MTAATVPATNAAASAATERARALVAERMPDALALGTRAGELVNDPGAAVVTLRGGLEALADPEYRAGIDRVAPGIGPVLGVRQPLLHAVGRSFRAETRRDRATTILDVADRLLREDLLELRWLAFGLLERTIRDDPERSWQLARSASARSADWVTVDTLAHVAARGILAEPYRWAELEQLVYSPSRWERRLVGSTIAVIPATDHRAGRSPDVVRHGLALVRDLMGDAEPDVQKALAWALRSLSAVDPDQTVAFLRDEARIAAASNDGYRAWVVRDSLEKVEPAIAATLRDAVSGIRRRAGAPSTSRAAETAAAFAGLGLDVPPADRPVHDRR